jgi:hypothetical protein
VSRWWTEAVASLGDVLPLPLAALVLVLSAALAAALWYWFPAWVPRRLPRLRRPRLRGLRWPRLHWRWPRLRWPRWRRLHWRRPSWPRLHWRWRRRRKTPTAKLDEDVLVLLSGEELPELPAATFASLADRFAAEGRYAEAVRERLRAMVRELVERRIIEHRPGWTVTELAVHAGRSRPAVDGPLRAAGAVFSDLWYAERPALLTHDSRMRELAEEVHQALAGRER